MSDMVKRVARAIYKIAYEGFDHGQWDDLSQDMRDEYLHQARAAISAMSEPTEDMALSMFMALDMKHNSVADICRIMADCALK